MRVFSLIIAALLLAGCASTPPLPPECDGELTPINGQQHSVETITERIDETRIGS